MSKKLVVDSSVLIVLSRKGTLEEYLKQKKREGYEVLIPGAVARELVNEPRRLAEEIAKRSPALASKITQSVEAINAAIGDDLIRVVPVNFRGDSKVIDNVRKQLSQLEAKPEHAVKKGDPELIVLIIQLLEYFQFQKDSEKLRLLIVVEEAHLWTSKDLPKDAVRFLDSAVRLLRKKGVGVMLVWQKISDFDSAMRSAMNISILFRTKYEGDLKTIARMLGSEVSRILPRLPVGYSILHLADVGEPVVIAWHPTYSQP